MKVEMIKNSGKLYKDRDFNQPNKMTMKKEKNNNKNKKRKCFWLDFFLTILQIVSV